MTELTWVNHASFVADLGGIRLMCDPWIEGTAFDDGWCLLSPSKFGYDNFSSITHIFFSHEHPDHFSPPNLKRIPAEIRRSITVLYHETRDQRLVKFCKTLGFSIRELPNRKWVTLGSGVDVLCGAHGLIDSWLAIRRDGEKILNLNDCVLSGTGEIKAVKGLVGDVNLLLTQFSYARWVGNPDDTDSHAREAAVKKDQMRQQLSVIQPKTLIPFASFVWFCHEENHYLNRGANRIDSIYEFATQELGVDTVILYPGDRWTVGGTSNDSARAIDRYLHDYALHGAAPILVPTTPVTMHRLLDAQVGYCRKAFSRNNRLILYLLPAATVHLSDLGRDLRISFRKGIEVLKSTPAIVDICLGSEALLYCFLFDWGGDTLAINGRYRIPDHGNAQKFFHIFRVGAHNAAGYNIDISLLLRRIWQKVTGARLESLESPMIP